MRTDRRWAWSGVAFAVLYILGFIVLGAGSPSDTAKVPKVLAYWHDHKGAGLGAAFLVVIAAIAMIFFASHLRSVFHRPEGDNTAATASLAGGVVVATGMLFMAAVRFAVVNAADNGQSEALSALNGLDNNDFFILVGGLATLFLATGIAIMGTRVLPRWLGIVSLVLGVISVAGPLGMVTFFLAPLWVLAVAVMLTRVPSEAALAR